VEASEPMTVRGIYRNGQVRLLERPEGVQEGEVAVTLANITDAGNEAASREARRLSALKRLRDGFDLGGSPYPTRDELHDRIR
jgi:hypothetical protein